MRSTTYYILIFVLALSAFVATVYPKDKIDTSLQHRIAEIDNALAAFQSELTKKDPAFIERYKTLRTAYKTIESYVVFRYPQLDKSINGGPVPSITTEIVILHKDDPHGLQVIEEMLVEDDIDLAQLERELQLLEKQFAIVKRSFKSYPLQHWEIFEANHMALSRLMTLGLTGFDSPALLLSREDAITVLKYVKKDMNQFSAEYFDADQMSTFNSLIDGSIAELNEATDYLDLKLYRLFRDHLVPLQSHIKAMHEVSGFEMYSEVSNNPRTMTNGKHLFSADYLDPLATFRGQINSFDANQLALGKILFYDPVLSGNNKRACASCHQANKAFADERNKSLAYDRVGEIDRNSPGLLNAAYQGNFFYDLRSEDMNDQIMHVFNNTNELNITQEEIIEKLMQSVEYQRLFKEAYSSFEQPISLATVKSSLELYVRSLIATESKFDKNIRGEEDNFSEEEELGANLFFGKAACATCHFPPHFNGFVPPHFNETEGEIIGVPNESDTTQLDDDEGVFQRFGIVYSDADYVKGMFKTPTVRNAALTAPYMHNGIYKDLESVVRFYNDGGGLGRGLDVPQQTLAADSLGLNEVEQKALIVFIHTLTDTNSVKTEAFRLPIIEGIEDRVWGGEY